MSNIATTHMNNPVYKEFVSPDLCRQLMAAGVDVNLACFWKVHTTAMLKSYTFDREDYYRKNDRLVESINPCQETYPAFQVGDLNLLLPDYWLGKDSNGYTLALDIIYKLPAETDKRLPDVYAKTVLTCIKKGILPAIKAVEVLYKTSLYNR